MTNSDALPIIYTQPGCTPCRAVVARFNNRGVPYELVDISEDLESYELLARAGIATTPAFDLGQGLTARVSDALEYVKAYRGNEQEEAA